MAFKRALWAAGFPELEDAVLSGALTSAPWIRITGLPQRLMAGSIQISEHGDGHLLITAKPDVQVRSAEVSIDATHSAASATFAAETLSVEVADTANLGAIKGQVDGLTGTPFTTAYVGDAAATDALNAGDFDYVFAPRTPAAALMVEIVGERDLRIARQLDAPPGTNSGTVFWPADTVFRGEVASSHNLWLRRVTNNNTGYSIRVWTRE